MLSSPVVCFTTRELISSLSNSAFCLKIQTTDESMRKLKVNVFLPHSSYRSHRRNSESSATVRHVKNLNSPTTSTGGPSFIPVAYFCRSLYGLCQL